MDNQEDRNNKEEKNDREEINHNENNRNISENTGVSGDTIRKIAVIAVPVILIMLIIIGLTIQNRLSDNNETTIEEQLQDSIKEYADGSISSKEEDSQENIVLEGDKASEQDSFSEADKDSEQGNVSKPNLPEKNTVDYSHVSFDWEEQLGEMMFYWEDNNQKALDDLANLERFKAMSWTLEGSNDYYYYGDVDDNGIPSGYGIAVYADNQYYCGNWVSGRRSGEGMYLHYHLSEKPDDIYNYHFYTGNWHQDLPEGEGFEHYEFIMEHLKEGIGYNQNLIGEYKQGLCHGEFYLTNLYHDGNVKEWEAFAEMGSWEYRNDNKDRVGRRPVQVETADPDNYIWMFPKDNKNIGVSCITSSGSIKK